MNQFLGVDSKLVQFFTLLGNLILLNLLWILTSLPIITAGAASAAMYAVIFQYAEGTDDAVLKPFIKSFLSNFRQSTLLWIPICLLFIMLGIDMVFLIGNAASGIAPLLWLHAVHPSVDFVFWTQRCHRRLAGSVDQSEAVLYFRSTDQLPDCSHSNL